jgi:hypothetical protein
MSMNHQSRPLLLLLNESFTCLNTELKQKQFTKYTHSEQLTLQPEIEKLEIK